MKAIYEKPVRGERSRGGVANREETRHVDLVKKKKKGVGKNPSVFLEKTTSNGRDLKTRHILTKGEAKSVRRGEGTRNFTSQADEEPTKGGLMAGVYFGDMSPFG